MSALSLVKLGDFVNTWKNGTGLGNAFFNYTGEVPEKFFKLSALGGVRRKQYWWRNMATLRQAV